MRNHPAKIRSRRVPVAAEVAELRAKHEQRAVRPKVVPAVVVEPQGRNEVRYEVLGSLLAGRRAKDDLSLRDVAGITGISPSTLSRVENGKVMDTGNVITLARWLGVSLGSLTDPLVDDVPQKINSILLSDPKLDKEKRKALCGTFMALYRQLTNGR